MVAMAVIALAAIAAGNNNGNSGGGGSSGGSGGCVFCDDNARGSNSTNRNCTKTLSSEEDGQISVIDIDLCHCRHHY
jgi:hypothetical protein